MQEERRIPKVAVTPLLEHCQKLSVETGKSAAEIFKGFLELMKKYADYFFREPWPEKLDKRVEFSDVDVGFIKGGKSYRTECERFTVVCLRRNISLEGFDAEGFDEDFKFHGNMPCWDCVVPNAVWLREHIKRVEEAVRENEEEMKQENPSLNTREMYDHYRRPEVVRQNGMMSVELRFYEEMGGAEGRSCTVKNKYRCPYGAKSRRLIELGRLVKFIWREIEWYDSHWNPSLSFSPAADHMKWYHYGEPSIIDVTSYDDIIEAIKDKRLMRIIEEHERYEKECKG